MLLAYAIPTDHDLIVHLRSVVCHWQVTFAIVVGILVCVGGLLWLGIVRRDRKVRELQTLHDERVQQSVKHLQERYDCERDLLELQHKHDALLRRVAEAKQRLETK